MIHKNKAEKWGINDDSPIDKTAEEKAKEYVEETIPIMKKYKLKSSADEYILWNTPLLSLQDIDATIEGYLPEFDELIKLAEERLNHKK